MSANRLKYHGCQQRHYGSVLACAFLAILMTACGGGDESSGLMLNDTPTSQLGEDPYLSTGLNGPTRGRIFEADSATYLDLDTGEEVQLAGDYAYPTPGGETVVELYENARFLPDGGCGGFSTFSSRIVFRDALTGLASRSMEFVDDVYGPIRVSPDGLSMVLNKKADLCDIGTNLTLLTTTGEVIVTFSDEMRSADWLPDSRLVSAFGQTISVQNQAGGTLFRRIADMSSVNGTPTRVAVSPDGSQVLFEMTTEASSFLSTVSSRNATVWAVNIDGSNLRQIATTSREDSPDNTFDDPQVNTPAWSPDGNSFLVTENYTSGGIVFVDVYWLPQVLPVSNEGLTYVVPANTKPVQLPPTSYSATGIRPIVGKELNGNIGATGISPFASYRWVPELAREPVVYGALPKANGRINRGIGGQIYVMGEDDDDNPTLKLIELSTGVVSDQTVITEDELNIRYSGSAVSSGATRTAHVVDEALQVYDSSGEQLYDLALISSNYHYKPESALRFSPTNDDYVAWIYDDDDFGTGAIAIELSTRTFVARWSNRDYDAITWTKEGDLLVFDEGRVYRSHLTDGTFGSLQYQFEISDIISHPDVNPATNEIAFTAGGQIFAVSIDGQNLRRMVANAERPVVHPAWSTDGRFLSVRMGYDGFIVAADTLNARIYDDDKSVGAFRIGEGVSTRMPLGYLRFEWR